MSNRDFCADSSYQEKIIYKFGNRQAQIVLIQPVGDHDLPLLEEEVREIERLTDLEFQLVAVKVENWNRDLAPWEAPAVFGEEGFGNGAAETLEEIKKLCTDKEKIYCIGGYSLAGLFSLWASCQTDLFSGVAAVSPSVWYPGFMEYMRQYKSNGDVVYLSLGDREERTRNPVMAKVGNCIREGYALLKEENIDCILEWNRGGHFSNPELRTAKGFVWVMRHIFISAK
ncbi:MAG: esterase [Clostridia bacterium]|nr:esterase [Clostridia bacterium]